MKFVYGLCFVIAQLAMTCFCHGATYGGGIGTEASPYQIKTPAQMNAIGLNSADWNKYFILTTNIDMSVITTAHNSIGKDSSQPFTGGFDGKGYTVSNFVLKYGNPVGLFGYTMGATIKNLGLKNVNISTAGFYAGGLIGYQKEGTITNCFTDGTISATSFPNQDLSVGGLVGVLDNGTISNCHSSAQAGAASSFSNSPVYVGGLAGRQLNSTITNSYTTGSINASSYNLSDAYAGGLTGSQYGGTITDCNTSGSVRTFSSAATSPFSALAGGLSGSQEKAVINNCFSTASVSAYSSFSSFAGGLAGQQIQSNIANSYYNGSVIADSDTSCAGGLAGYQTHCSIDNSYSLGDVTSFSSDDSYAGGLAGLQSYCAITNSCSRSAVNCYSAFSNSPSSPSAYAGGLAGWQFECQTTVSFSSGSVSSFSDLFYAHAGGLVGYQYNGTIANCCSYGPVSSSSSSESYAGGLVGSSAGKITNCYSAGTITPGGSGTQFIGGLIGQSSVAAVNSFWDTQTSGQPTSAGGTGVKGKTTANMKKLATFTGAGWDFTNESANGKKEYWRMCVNDIDYPRLNWEFTGTGDLLCPAGVNLADFTVFAEQWLMRSKLSADIADAAGGDNVVDLKDYKVFAGAWLSISGQVKWNPLCDISPAVGDDVINELDIIEFANQWLTRKAWNADINRDGLIDIKDFTIIAQNWLVQNI